MSPFERLVNIIVEDRERVGLEAALRARSFIQLFLDDEEEDELVTGKDGQVYLVSPSH